MGRLRTASVAVAVTMTLCGCGVTTGGNQVIASAGDGASGAASAAGGATLVPDEYSGDYMARTTVLESPDHGPQLCLGGVAESYPPQCGGPDVSGWDWATVEHEAASGTRWGDYTVIGSWDGSMFTMSDAAAPPPSDSRYRDVIGTPVPCPEPDGGWAPVDPGRTTRAALEEASELARALPGYGNVRWDQPPPVEPVDEDTANDPALIVLVVTTTDDVLTVEAAMREVWGGALCVAPALRTEAEMQVIQMAAGESVGALGSSSDATSGQVVLQVVVATADLQRRLDAEFGDGVVRLDGALQPLDP